jgi:DUF1680 family protein
MSFATSLPLAQVSFDRGLLAERARLVRRVVIPRQWAALNDRIPGVERSGCVRNVKIASGSRKGKFHGLFWQDSDLAKWMEAASHRLATHPTVELNHDLNELIDHLSRAQMTDGYLNTYFQLVEPEKRFTNLRDAHELYVAGHLIEAGIAHFEGTGKQTFLAIVIRIADLITAEFGRGAQQRRGYCGHPEIELALIKLARVTGHTRYRDTAAYFVDERGRSPNFFEAEAKRRGEDGKLPWHMHHDGLATLQAAVPVSELTQPVGHAVRMMYLLAAMIDLARERRDRKRADQCRKFWTAIVSAHLYVTGGVGSEPYGEKFCEPHDLPTDRAYAETCAAIGVMMCARRMLELELRGEYGDVLERALYNNVLAGMSADGLSFFYVNPLEVVPAVAKRRFECHLVKTQRVGWFGCACCPPNLARVLTSLGDYAYSRVPHGLAVHLYASGHLWFKAGDLEVRLNIETDYPWDGRVEVTIDADDEVDFALHLRIPAWCRAPRLSVNGRLLVYENIKNYARLRKMWQPGDRILLELPMPVERVHANPKVSAVAGQVALQRGPIVYCVESVDNGANLAGLSLPRSSELSTRPAAELPDGSLAIEGAALRDEAKGPLYSNEPAGTREVTLRAVPYAFWANRGEGEMRVWLRES